MRILHPPPPLTSLPQSPPTTTVPESNSSSNNIIDTEKENCTPSPMIPLRILTHNIRYSNTDSPFWNEKPWTPTRRTVILRNLLYHTRNTPHSIICLQEVLSGQLKDVLNGLNQSASTSTSTSNTSPIPRPSDATSDLQPGDRDEEWTYYGLGRDNGLEAGEHEPIIWRRRIWQCIFAQTIWLCADSPFVPGSKGWDAASVRVCGVVVLQLRSQGRSGGVGEVRDGKKEAESRDGGDRIMILNTHLDDQGRVSRIEGAKLILKFLQRWKTDHGIDDGRVVIAGDLNSEDTAAAAISPDAITREAAEAEAHQTPRQIPRQDQDKEAESADMDAWTIFNSAESGLRDVRHVLLNDERLHGQDHWAGVNGSGEQDRCCHSSSIFSDSSYAFYGNQMTFTGFNGRGDGEGRCTRIDFIFVGCWEGEDGGKGNSTSGGVLNIEDEEKKAGVVVTDSPSVVSGYAVLPNVFDDGVYMSDHRAVVADLVMR